MNSRDREPLSPEERDLARRLSQLGGHVAPPGSLDTKILAAARDAVQGRPRRARPRWPFGIGIAASLAIAMGVAWQLRPLPESEVLPVPSETAPAARMMEPAAPSAAPAQAVEDAAAPAAREADAMPPDTPAEAPAAALEIAAPPVERVQRAPPPAEPPLALDAPAAAPAPSPDIGPTPARAMPPPPPPAAPAPRASPAPAAAMSAPAAQEAAAAKAGTEEHERRAQATSAASMRAAGARPDDTALDRITATGSRIRHAEPVAADRLDEYLDEPLDEQPPVSFASPQARDAWLQRIRELVDEGERDAARASLREFRRRYPQHPVPADLKALLEE
jgi:resuscitation-promoting factor RpfA